jgi:rod shape determining protein RodA
MLYKESNNKGIFKSLDWITIGLYVVLLFWCWFSVCGACYDYNKPDLFSFELNSGKQFVWILTSLLLAGALLLIEKRFYYQTSTFVYVMMVLVLLITIFIAPDTKGSRSWIPIGPIKLQPAEFAKFAVALAVGKYMERYGFSLSTFKDFYKVVLLFIVPMLLIIAQKETGTALVYLSFFLVGLIFFH